MWSDLSIEVTNISKCYRVYDNPRDRFAQILLKKRKLYREFWALKDISFNISKGESVGLIGKNGSGKSTLLQIICNTLKPTTGTVKTRGTIAALLELGSGFNPEFTGRENIFLNGAILGLSAKEIENKFDSIASFADIGDYLEQPVKNYSSGMAVRLAFAVQAQIEPEILIVDEALAVGDARFQAKCFNQIKRLQDAGTSILLVSHASEQIIGHCSKALLLNDGKLIEQGKPKGIVNQYLGLLFGKEKLIANDANQQKDECIEKTQDLTPENNSLSNHLDIFHTKPCYNQYEYRWGDGAATILDYHFHINNETILNSAQYNTDIILDISVRFNSIVTNPVLGVTIKNKEGLTIFGSNSILLESDVLPKIVNNNESYYIRVKFKNNLSNGDYFISLGIASRKETEVIPHDRRYDSIHFVVSDSNGFFGIYNFGMELKNLEKLNS